MSHKFVEMTVTTWKWSKVTKVPYYSKAAHSPNYTTHALKNETRTERKDRLAMNNLCPITRLLAVGIGSSLHLGG
jgi:hypothetical protein